MRRVAKPDDECIANGTKLLCQICQGARRFGEVRDEQGHLRWRYSARANPSGWRLGNPLKKTDFVFSEPDQKDETIIRRVSFLPSTFEIVEVGAVIGTIKMLSIFRNEYSILMANGKSWTFRMPLYTVLFFGVTESACEIWVRLGSEREWNILIKPGIAQRCLIAALAFIHNERYFYG
jgi:hypothetical protein